MLPRFSGVCIQDRTLIGPFPLVEADIPNASSSLLLRLFRALARVVGGRGWGLQRIPLLSRVYDALASKVIPQGVTVAKVDGQEMYVKADNSHIAKSLIIMGAWEPEETEVFLSLLQPHMTFLDVGAHVGYYTLLAAKRVAQVYAFEPDPESLALLLRSVQANGHTNVGCFQKAVADKVGRARFHIDSEAWGNSLSPKNVNHPVRLLDVETVSLDHLYASGALGEHIHLVKIDVQGAEEAVLRGAATILATCRPIVLMEVEPKRLRNMGTDPYRLLERLGRDHSYDIRAIEGAQPDSVEDIVALAERESIIDVVATPRKPAEDRSAR